MNIFVTSKSPLKSAKNLDNKRVIKMILESAQMLSTALHKHLDNSELLYRNCIKIPYRPTHINHPCSIWAAETRKNYWWLFRHYVSLCREYEYRYGKTHKCQQYLGDFYIGTKIIPEGKLTKFSNCTSNKDKNISFKHIVDPIEAYKQYLAERWNTDTLKPKWTNRPTPNFYKAKI
jgi:hypothetical protein